MDPNSKKQQFQSGKSLSQIDIILEEKINFNLDNILDDDDQNDKLSFSILDENDNESFTHDFPLKYQRREERNFTNQVHNKESILKSLKLPNLEPELNVNANPYFKRQDKKYNTITPNNYPMGSYNMFQGYGFPNYNQSLNYNQNKGSQYGSSFYGNSNGHFVSGNNSMSTNETGHGMFGQGMFTSYPNNNNNNTNNNSYNSYDSQHQFCIGSSSPRNIPRKMVTINELNELFFNPDGECDISHSMCSLNLNPKEENTSFSNSFQSQNQKINEQPTSLFKKQMQEHSLMNNMINANNISNANNVTNSMNNSPDKSVSTTTIRNSHRTSYDQIVRQEIEDILENELNVTEVITEQIFNQFKGYFFRILNTQNGSRILQKCLKLSPVDILSRIFHEVT